MSSEMSNEEAAKDLRVAVEEGIADSGEFNEAMLKGAAALRRLDELEKWEPTSEMINKLPLPLRGFIHDLETRCDPGGDIQRLVLTKDENASLRIFVAQLKEELERVKKEGSLWRAKFYAALGYAQGSVCGTGEGDKLVAEMYRLAGLEA